MTDAIFKACYSEWKLVKTRGTVQIVFEMPVEQSDAAYQALGGMPIAAREVWCGIARLDPSKEHPLPPHPAEAAPRPAPRAPQPLPVGENKSRRPLSALPYSQQAALRCQDARFRAFLRETNRRFARNEDEARDYVLEYCNIKSRADIKPGTEAETYWLDIDQAFDSWLTDDRAFA